MKCCSSRSSTNQIWLYLQLYAVWCARPFRRAQQQAPTGRHSNRIEPNRTEPNRTIGQITGTRARAIRARALAECLQPSDLCCRGVAGRHGSVFQFVRERTCGGPSRSTADAHSHARCSPAGVSHRIATARGVQATRRPSTFTAVSPYLTQAVIASGLGVRVSGC